MTFYLIIQIDNLSHYSDRQSISLFRSTIYLIIQIDIQRDTYLAVQHCFSNVSLNVFMEC